MGGKKALRDEIIRRFPADYERYIEVFGGGGWVLFHKAPGRDFEVYNDRNSLLTNLYRCVQEKPEELKSALKYALNSRAEFDRIRDNLSPDNPTDDVQRAAWFYQLIRYSYASGLTSFAAQPHDMWSKLTSVKLDDGGSFTSTYTTGDGGYISKEDLDFSKLPTGSYVAQEITPPEGYILSSDVSKVKQAFTWDGEHDISLVFENSSKVKVQLKKVDEAGKPLAGAIFVILRDGKVIGTEETKTDGTITMSNVSEGYYEFREVSAPVGYDCDHTPVGVHVNAEDLQGEQTITVEKVNHKLRTLTIQKRDAESGSPIANTSHIRGVNLAYENDVVTGADGKVALSEMASGCYEITETKVPSPYILDTNNRKTVWIDASQGKDIVVDFVNSTKPGLRLVKTDYETGKPIENQDETPYTETGRQLNFERTKKKRIQTRLDELYSDKSARAISYGNWGKLNNFEFIMNRVYALNRDKLKCRVCGGWLISSTPWAHRVNPNLPLNKVNRVNNLVLLHKKCFYAVNNLNQDISEFDVKAQKKIIGYREKLIPSHTRNN